MKLTVSELSGRPEWPWAALGWVGILTGIALRFVWLGKKSVWFDEGYTAWMISHPPREMLRLIRADTCPPLYYLLLRFWTDIFGTSEAALRSLSSVFSAATILLFARLAGKLLPLPAACAAIWLLALGFHQEFYGQEARAYALMALLTVAALVCLLNHLSGRGQFWLIPLVLLAAAALYTHNVMPFYLGGMAVAWLILPSAHSIRRRLIDASIVAIGAMLLFLPWIVTALFAQIHLVQISFWAESPTLIKTLIIISWIAGIPTPESWNLLIYSLHSPHALGQFPAWFGLILIVVCMAAGFWFLRGSALREFLGLAALVLIPPAIILAYSLASRPILMDKIFLPSSTLMPILFLLPLRGDWRARGARCAAIATVIFLLVLQVGVLINYFSTPQKEDWRAAAALVQSLPVERRLIVFVANDGQLPFDYYYHYRSGDAVAGAPAGFFDRDPPRTMLRVVGPKDVQSVEATIDREKYDHVVLIMSHWKFADPDGFVLQALSEKFPRQTGTIFLDVSVYCFDR